MARFDVFATRDGGLVVDCQSDSLAYLRTRVVAPLLATDVEPQQAQRLNPDFEIRGQTYVLFPQFVATIDTAELTEIVAKLDDQSWRLVDAFDMLLTGY